MFIVEIKHVIEQISRDKGIDRDVLVKAVEEAIQSAARKKFGNGIDIETQYDEKTGEIEVFQFMEVAETVTDPDTQVTLEEGRRLDPECELGDSLGTKMDTSNFGRIAAQSAKQVIIQKMKDAERDAVYSNYVDRKGELINGIVQRFERGDIIVNIGQTEGIVPFREQVPRESYRRGDRIRAYILDILHDTRGPQIILSRTHPNFLIQLFKTEVPEISEGIVSIMGAAREPGIRAKIAVSSNDSDIDPVGACVGMRGSRVQNVVQELKGEKIDIIPYHIAPPKYVCNALAPAEVSRVIIDEENQTMEIIVPDDALSIAIGKRGQNVRLAAKLTRWRLDVKSESSYNADMKNGYDSLGALPDISLGLVDALFENGFYSVEELSRASVNDLVQIREIDEEMAETLITNATIAWEEMAAAAEAAIDKEEKSEDHFAGDGKSPDPATEAVNSLSEPESSERANVTIAIDEEVNPTTETTNSGEAITSPSMPENKAGSKDDSEDKPILKNNDTN
jgi:N utilization substance protein A